ncbi:MAG: rod shape-determining protein [Candidatus Tectomicrobia bacterium]|uniref:Cell shape-determining protein MreB n=1 Tax=Tectimicrobiota bacterium TaxID=2528274 RepID=A0A932CQG9_UNCTE|nr:rod shape-determining protein [Candidatus Tectomicrobia bacterium]
MFQAISLPHELFARDLAMDLGTTNTLIYQKGRGIVLDEASVIAFEEGKNAKVYALGKEAKGLYGKTPEGIKSIQPIRDGVVADSEAAYRMISSFLRQAIKGKVSLYPFCPKMILCVPTSITPAERKALLDWAQAAEVRRVYLIPDSVAAALGAGVPIQKAKATMIVDIGGGTTEVAILSSGGVARHRSLRVAGDKMDEAIVRYLRLQRQLEINRFQAEQIKIEIGSAYPLPMKRKVRVKGQDVIAGRPRALEVDSDEIQMILAPSVKTIVAAILSTVTEASSALAADLPENGIVLAGGGSLLKGWIPRLIQETGLPVRLAVDPLQAVVRGAGMVLEDPDQFRSLCFN